MILIIRGGYIRTYNDLCEDVLNCCIKSGITYLVDNLPKIKTAANHSNLNSAITKYNTLYLWTINGSDLNDYYKNWLNPHYTIENIQPSKDESFRNHFFNENSNWVTYAYPIIVSKTHDGNYHRLTLLHAMTINYAYVLKTNDMLAYILNGSHKINSSMTVGFVTNISYNYKNIEKFF